jgi:hypothetical protein
LDKDRELVPTDAKNVVGCCRRLRSDGRCLDQRVTGMVSEAIIGDLRIIQIED